jgi:hypothetical protein
MVPVNLGDPSPAIPQPPPSTTATRSLTERVGTGLPMLAVLTIVGALVGGIVKIFRGGE